MSSKSKYTFLYLGENKSMINSPMNEISTLFDEFNLCNSKPCKKSSELMINELKKKFMDSEFILLDDNSYTTSELFLLGYLIGSSNKPLSIYYYKDYASLGKRYQPPLEFSIRLYDIKTYKFIKYVRLNPNITMSFHKLNKHQYIYIDLNLESNWLALGILYANGLRNKILIDSNKVISYNCGLFKIRKTGLSNRCR